MNQLEICSEYIKEKLPNFSQDKNNKHLFYFDEGDSSKTLCIVEEKIDEINNRELLFSSDFKLLLSDEELETKADYFAFCFGGQFFYIDSKKVDSPKLNILRYLGNYPIINDEFCHLGIHSCYSLLEGCQKIELYVKKAKYLGMKALGICEKRTLASLIKFQEACEKEKIKSILGEDLPIKIDEKIYTFKFYIKNAIGYQNLIRLSNIVNVFGRENGEEYILESDLKDYLEGLIVILPNNFPFSNNILKKYSKEDTYYQIDTVAFLDNQIYYEYLSNIKNYKLKQA